MIYLRRNELVEGRRYRCVFYAGGPQCVLKYLGGEWFWDDAIKCPYTLKGDIRYVLEEV